MQTEQTQKIMGYFIEEAKDHFNTIEHGILNLPNTIADRELLNELFRAAHSVKGGAAMLEINSVRNIAHRLEDSFKILRETSIKVDNKLESLYLSVLDTLQDLLEQLSNSGLTEKEEKTQLEKLEPVFQELEEHLDDLAGETHGITIGKIPELNVDKQSFFMAEVSEKMREMLLLFKQNDDASTRNKLKNICDFLAGQGRQEHVSSNWLKLIEAIKKAIANTENTYYTLAHNIIKNLKQAEELIRDNREQEILIDEKLKALTKNAEYINKNIGEIDMLNETKNQQNQTNINERINNKNDILTQKKESINDWFNSLEARDIDNNNYDLIGDQQEVRQGPEVGVTELNSLADLFEGETPELDSSWEEEEILDKGNVEGGELKISEIERDDSSDLSDLLFDVNEVVQSSKIKNHNESNFLTPVEEDLSDLFNNTKENTLQKKSNVNKQNTNLQLDNSEAKHTEYLDDLFNAINQGDLTELEDIKNSENDRDLQVDLPKNNLQKNIKSISKKINQKYQVDEDFSDLLGIQDEGKKIKNDVKVENNQSQIQTKNDLNSKVADLEALFEDLDTVNEQQENQIESDDLTSSFSKGFDREDVDLSDSQKSINVEQINWEDDNNDLNSLFDDPNLDFINLDSNESLDNLIESDNEPQENSEISVNIEDLWPTVENHETVDETVDLNKLLEDVVSETTSLESEKNQQLTAKNQIESEEYEFIELEAILNGEKLDNYNIFVQLEKLLNGTEINSKLKSNIAVVEKTPPIHEAASITKKLPEEDPFSDLDKLLETPNIDTYKSSGVSTANTPRRNRRPPEQTVKVPAKQLDNLSNLVGELVVNRNSLEQGQERMRQFLDNLLHQVMLLSDAGQRMHDLYEKTLLERAIWDNRQGHHSTTTMPESTVVKVAQKGFKDSLDLDRVENFTPFHLLAQETIEYIVRVRESSSDIEFLVDDAEQVTRQLRQVTTQLQEGLTRSRMIPFSQTVQLLPRAVRDISMECGKEVSLQVEGKETLIDKMIQDKLSDPMKHLINNAITHGVETPQQRLAAGKSRQGKITIRAFHQGNQTVISVADNGAGINAEKVKKKAIEKGLITQQQAKGMSNIDVYDLLFHPGFSTKDKADNFSGRGVGLDVVKTNLTEIRGTISIDSTIGKGTIFTIRLPLTLSISKALCCISDRSWIAFPMDGVEDMIKVSKEEVKAEENGQYYIEWRGSKLPFRHLRELLVYNRHLRRGNVYGINAEEDMISIVVLRSASAGIFLAVQVDQVLEQQKEIVIKQLEGPIPKPIGIAGATVLGDGNIVAIADVIELINLATGRLRRDEGNMWSSSEEDEASLPVQQKSELTVLIVDDSITVRELLSMTFSKAGYRVEQARDGKDAWEKMRAGLPCDLVFCDIEMPRMDGFELLSRMQKDSHLNTLPVAMLTSRGAKKHMEMAFELGAKGYFTKPYIEDKLLEGAVSILEGKAVGDILSGGGY
ncbi:MULTISPECIES: response regulator [unclassified Okeania]|uniref:response regulator n=1 Tax=unclassified Okeania TaxID=2634635 RepID=UPI0013BAC694|nr:MULTISPECIES: response regulator [unclassified Okeania]NES75731.1 response regulator [Okeania sp. SIO1H4]NET19913.1 response regulator [Okeania sp. SIO1H5]NET91747.1 response regulator [Okeania sp. SIO1H2]